MNRKLGLLVLAIVAGAFPLVVKSQYVLQVTDSALIYAVAVIGLGILLGFAGQMSLAQAAFFGIGAYSSALLALHLNWPFWIVMPLAVLISALIGAIVGYPCLRLSGHYLALATIGFGIIVQLVFVNWTALTNGPDGLTGIPAPQIGGADARLVPIVLLRRVRSAAALDLRCLARQAFAHRPRFGGDPRERDRRARDGHRHDAI